MNEGLARREHGPCHVLVLQRYLSPEAVLTTWKQACNRSV